MRTGETIKASDNIAVTRVEFYLDGILQTTVAAVPPAPGPSPYLWSWNTASGSSAASNGFHTLTAKAYDAAGNSCTSQSVTVTVSNAPAIPIPGDINLDHVVNALDYSIMNSHWFQTGSTPAMGDINGDGIVNSLDFAILKSNWGKTW